MAILDANDIDFVFLVGQPIMGIIAILITLFLCFILGLPIRLIPKVYNWWTNKPIICFVGVAIGIALILISYNSHLIETVKVVTDGVERTKQVSNSTFGIIGWFITAFFLFNFYPLPILVWIKKKLFGKHLIQIDF